jgi:hypothetical protein
MVVRPHEVMTERTARLETTFYDLLAVCDEYRISLAELLATERAADTPRDQLVHRLEQMSGRIERIITILEDDALTELLPLLDRLFTLERAERGEDI